MSQLIENINKDKSYRKELTGILKLKSTIGENKNVLKDFKSTFERAKKNN